MDAIFKALADRHRREMLDRLYAEPGLTLSELVADLEITRQSASRHVSILEQAGLVATHWRGREKLHYLNPLPVVEISDRWLDKFSENKALTLLALRTALEDQEK